MFDLRKIVTEEVILKALFEDAKRDGAIESDWDAFTTELSIDLDEWFESFNDNATDAAETFGNEKEQEREDADLDSEDYLAANWPDVRAAIVETYGEDDEVALNEGFNDWTDGLCQNDMITENVYNSTTRVDVEREAS